MIVTSDLEDSEVSESEDEAYKYRSNTTSKKPAKGNFKELFKLKESITQKDQRMNKIKAMRDSRKDGKENFSKVTINFNKTESL